MAKIEYMTLAAVRDANSDSFDKAVRVAVHEAAEMVGKDVVIKALSESKSLALAQAA